MEMRAEGKVYKRPSKRPATESAKRAIADPAAKIQNQLKYQAEEGSKPETPVQVAPTFPHHHHMPITPYSLCIGSQDMVLCRFFQCYCPSKALCSH